MQIDFDTLLFALSEEQLANFALLNELKAYMERLAGLEGGKNDTNEFEFKEIPLVAVEWEDVDFALFWCEDHVAEDIRFDTPGSANKIDRRQGHCRAPRRSSTSRIFSTT